MHHPNVMIHACYIFFPRRTWTEITPSNGTWRLLCGSDKREYVGPMRLIGGSSPWVFIRSPVPLGKSSTCLARGPYCIPSGNSSRTGESFLLYKLRWAILLCMHRLSYGIIPHSSRSAQPGVQCWYEMRRAAQARRSVRSLATCHASTMRHNKLRDVAVSARRRGCELLYYIVRKFRLQESKNYRHNAPPFLHSESSCLTRITTPAADKHNTTLPKVRCRRVPL